MPSGASLTHRLVRRVIGLAPSALGESPPAVDGVSDPSGPRFVEGVVAIAGVLVHAGLYWGTGRSGFLWVTILSGAYLLVGIPVNIRMARVSPNLATWGNLVTFMVLAFIMGDPITLLAWFPILVIANLIYLDSATGVRNAVRMALAAAIFFVVMVRTSDRLFDASLARTYLLATLFMWLLSSAAYSLAIGGAVNRQVAAMQAALGQRDEAESRARSEAVRLRALLEEAPIGLLLQGPDETFDYGNAPALEMLGLTEGVLFAHGTTPSMEQSTLDRVEQEVVIAREQGKAFLVEFQTVAGRILELRGRHVDLGDSSTTVSTIRDLTPERDARRHIARLRTLVENSQTHMVVWNRLGEIVVANRVFRERWSALRPVEGRLVTEVMGEQVRRLFEMPDLHREQSFEMEIVMPDEESLWVNISIADFPDPYDDEWLRSISVRDLTEVAHARRQLEQLVVSKDRFIASVSHELRTPLTVVVGLAAELADRPERLSTEEVQEFASLICSQANDVAAIVEDLLTMARAQAGALTVNCQRIDLEAIVGEVVGSLPTDAVKKVVWAPRSPEWVWADPIRLRQILRNLVTNADRHGGQFIEVQIQRGALLVKDDGPPVAEEDRERMFEAYEQIGRPTGRTDSVGLGLAVCRLLSRLMDGDVAYSHDGAHSIFTLTLPVSQSHEAKASTGEGNTSMERPVPAEVKP